MIRTFFAIPVVPEACPLIHEAMRPMMDSCSTAVSFTPEKKWHVTVRFLGHVDQSTLERLSQSALEITRSIKKFSMIINKIAGFPSKHSSIIAAHVKPEKSLSALFKALDDAAAHAGLKREERSFKPHLTLAKFEKHHHEHFEPIFPEALILEAKCLVLFESQRRGSRNEYLALQHFPLQ